VRRLHAELEIFGWRRILNRHIGGEPSIADADVAMLEIAGFDQAAPERVNDVYELARRFHAKKPDHPHPRLLRMRRDGGRDRGSAATRQRRLNRRARARCWVRSRDRPTITILTLFGALSLLRRQMRPALPTAGGRGLMSTMTR
jgi:hypothetical protein